MKTSRQLIVFVLMAFGTFVFVSWNKNEKTTKKSKTVYDSIFSVNNEDLPWSASPEMSAYFADLNGGIPDKLKKIPAAEDVLVQKIPGDNYHLLLMAVYSYENYAETTVTVDNGAEQLTLRDDGQGFDKVAGDGIFTTKIYADVKEFTKAALAMHRNNLKDKQAQFYNREILSPENCLTGAFSAELLEKNQAVSIAALSSASTPLLDSVRNNCIFITDIGVVEDPTRTWNPCTQTGNIDGAWTFKTIMKNLAKTSETDPTDAELSAFVMDWLHNWQVDKEMNGDTVLARTGINENLILPWLEKSALAGAPEGQLDMHYAPFKLTAIINRFDLRERAAGIPAGEGRYTFCLIDPTCTDAMQGTVVIEYGINSKSICDSLQNWALRWYNLKDLTLGSPEYNAALQDITDRFSLWGSAPGREANLILNAIRTNEIAFAPEDGSVKRYEFRQFNLATTPTKAIVQRLVEQIPQDKYNAQVENPDVVAMVTWINNNGRAIKNDAYTVPESFLGGHSQILGPPVGLPTGIYHWDGVATKRSPARISNTTVRHVFSRNTCTGCHAGEIQTFFTHVDPVFFGSQATLSGFLTGTAGRGGAVDFDNIPDNDSMMVRDAAGRGGVRNSLRMFNDILRRAKDLKDFVFTPPCTLSSKDGQNVFAIRNRLMFTPLNSVH